MRISDWSSDVCSSDRAAGHRRLGPAQLAVLESEVAADDPLPLDKSDRPDRLARRQHGQPALLQRFVAMIEDRARGTEACGKEGRPRQAAARLMGDAPKLDEPQAEPAISFGHRHSGPAQLRRGGPEGLEKAVPG